MSRTIQEEIKARLYTDSFGENLAVIIYEAMRFDRKDETPDWEISSNSQSQNEARAVAASVIERFRECLRDLPEATEGKPRFPVSDQGHVAKETERYHKHAHRVQCALAFMEGDRRMEPKQMRTGIDMTKADMGGLANLLIKKGVFTLEEYLTHIADQAEIEADAYEDELSVKHGINIETN